VAESRITEVTHGTNAVTGEDEFSIEYADGERQTQPGTFAEARDLALRAGLDGMEPMAGGTTRWYRRA
jgi:hypothetical protein